MSATDDTAAADTPNELRRTLLSRARRVVVKVGSRLLRESPVGRPATIADQVAALRKQRGLEPVIVSSGAISLGMRALGMTMRPHELSALQAIAAVGQRDLLQHWDNAFRIHGLTIAQVLLTHDDVSDRTRFLNARHTFRELLAYGVVPIVNENDTVSAEEITFGDNDLLAALVCNLVSADALVILTDVDGLHDAAPDDGGKRIPIVRDVDSEAAPFAKRTRPDGIGSGGMASKVKAARMNAHSGIPTVVIPGTRPGAITAALSGADLGTIFAPSAARLSSRKHWIAYARRPVGQITIDAGARRALVDRGRSLLPAGVTEITGDFRIGDIVSVVDTSGIELGRGLVAYSAKELRVIKGLRSADIESALGYKYVDEVIHRDDLVIL